MRNCVRGSVWRVGTLTAVAAAWLAFAANAGCGGGGAGGEPDAAPPADSGVSAGEGGDTSVPSVDVPAGQDAGAVPTSPDVPAPPGPPQVSVSVWRAGGYTSDSSGPVVLTPQDEPAKWKSKPGFQTDVRVEVSPAGGVDMVVLFVDGTAVASRKGAETTSPVVFAGVDLETGPHVLRATAQVGTATGMDEMNVALTQAACTFDVTPPAGACFGEDADAFTDGFQVRFGVDRTGGSCKAVQAVYSQGGTEWTTPPVPFDETGHADVTFTPWEEAAAPDGSAFSVRFVATNERGGSGGSAGPFDYTLDAVAPTLTVDLDAPVTIYAAADADGDPSNGVQLEVTGSAAGVGPNGKVEATLDGVPAASAPIASDGSYSLVVTVPAGPPMTLRVEANDGCHEPATWEGTVQRVDAPPPPVVAAPQDGAVLWSKDDADPSTPLTYETTFTVQLAGPAASGVVSVRCQGSVEGFYAAVGDAPASGSTVEVPVAIDTGALGTTDVACHARYEVGGQASTGPDVHLTVALPAPVLQVTSPASGAWVSADTLEVGFVAAHLDGQIVTATVYDAQGTPVAQADSAPIDGGSGTVAVAMTDASGMPLPDGSYEVRLDATDAFGNAASEQPGNITAVSFAFDRTPPALQPSFPPATLHPWTDASHADADPLAPGYQVAWIAQTEPGATVCLSVGDESHCAAADASGLVAGAPVTLAPPSAELLFEATDAAGNVTQVAHSVEIHLEAPVVVLDGLPPSGVTSKASLALNARAIATAENVPIVNGAATLYLNGAVAGTANVQDSGMFSFAPVSLQPGPNTVEVVVEHGGVSASSGTFSVAYKATAPSIAIAQPTDGAVANTGAPWCAPGAVDCEATVVGTTANVETGQSASLVVTCDAATTTLQADVDADAVTWTGVVLPDGATCTLQATVDDAAGQTATSAPVSVHVDRTPPVILALELPGGGDVLGPAYDLDPIAPGLQIDVGVHVQGIEAGQTVELTASVGDQVAGVWTATVPKDVPPSSSLLVDFGTVDLPTGLVTLRAECSDAAGNPASAFLVTVPVLDHLPLVGFTSPPEPDATACSQDADCGVGAVCEQGACAVAWGIEASKVVEITAFDLVPDLHAPMARICSDAPGVGGSACATPGFRVVQSFEMDADTKEVDLSSLPDGLHHLVAEVETWWGSGEWVSSIDHPDPALKGRAVLIDTEPPVVTAVTWPSDTQPPAGTFNAAELDGTTGQAQVAISEDATVEVRVDGQVSATPAVAAPGGFVDVDFGSDGTHAVEFHAIDRAGNPSEPAADVVANVTVDTTPPALGFGVPATLEPLTDPARADEDPATPGYQTTVTVDATGLEAGQSVCLSVGGVAAGCVEPADGVATFAGVTLQAGDNALEATAADVAGNAATAATTVHVALPQPAVTIASPVDGTVTAEATIDVEVHLSDPSTGDPIAAATVSIERDGVSVATATATAPGTWIASAVPLAPGDNVLQAVVEAAGMQAASAPVTVTRKTSTPGIALEAPVDGEVLNVASTTCTAPGADCVVDAMAVVTDAEDGAAATLSVDCNPGDSSTYQTSVASGAATWHGVALPDGATCTLSASVVDAAGQAASSAPVTVRVDRTPPSASIEAPAAGLIAWKDDTDATTPGLQATVAVTFDGLDDSSAATLAIVAAGGFVDTQQLDLPAGQASATVSVPGVTLPDGAVTLRIEVVDGAGNGAAVEVPVVAVSAPPAVAWVQPQSVAAAVCAVPDDCPTGTCIEGTCALAWGAGATRAVKVDTSKVPFDAVDAAIRVCTDGPTAGGAPCDAGGTVVATAPVTSPVTDVDLSGVPDGLHHFHVEVALDGGAVTSAAGDASTSPLTVWIDTVAPAVDPVQISSDIYEPYGVLGANEQEPDGTYQVAAYVDEPVQLVVAVGGGVFTSGWAGPGWVAVSFDPGADGAKTLDITVVDRAGNATQPAPIAVTVDRTPPSLAFAWPPAVLNPVLHADQADENPDLAGLQTTVRLDAGQDASQVCLFVDGVAAACAAPIAGQVVFPATTVGAGGIHSLVAHAIDSAGNGSDASLDVEVQWKPATVAVSSPTGGTWTTADTVDFVFDATDTSTGLPVPQVHARIVASGTVVFDADLAAADGHYVAAGIPLVPGDNAFELTVTAGGLDTVAPAVTVHRKTAVPSLAFAQPTDGEVLNAQAPACAPGGTDCALDVVVSTTNVEEGQPATLHVQCGPQYGVDYDAQVQGGEILFSGVVLPDGKTCLLSASATDVAAQQASAQATVRIDRTAPQIVAFAAPADSVIQYYADEDPTTPGMQKTIAVTVAGVEAGQSVEVMATGSTTGTWTATVPQDVADGSSLTVNMGQVTLADGEVTLTANVVDAAGNAAIALSHTYFVNASQPTVRLLGPQYVEPTACGSSADCAAGVCWQGACVLAWNATSSREVYVETSGFPFEQQTLKVRVCSDHPGVTGVACAASGYHVVAEDVLGSAAETVDVSAAPDGKQTFEVEVEAEAGGQWIASVDTPDATARSRTVLIDTVPPSVVGPTSPSDADAPYGVLNAAEAAPDGTYTFMATVSEPATAVFSVDGSEVASQWTDGGPVQANVDPGADGDHVVTVEAVDVAGNTSTPAEATWHVDRTPPALSFVAPDHSPVIAGEGVDVVVATEDGASVVLHDGAAAVGTAMAQNGLAVFQGALTDGTHTFEATATDAAGNAQSVATTPASVVVDTAPPTVVLNSPAPGTTLTDADDADPTAGGFQVAVQFDVTDAASWKVRVASGCAPDYTGCGPAVVKAEGTPAAANGGVGPVLVTLPVASTPYEIVDVVVHDEHGNSTKAAAPIVLDLKNCQMSFVTVADGQAWSAADCAAPGCTTVDVPVGVQFVGPCGSLDAVEFLRDGAVVATVTSLANYEASTTLTLADGDVAAVEARGLSAGAEVVSTGVITLAADLSAPTVELVAGQVLGFATPAGGSTVDWNAAADADPSAPGMQFALKVSAADAGPGQGKVVSVQYAPAGTDQWAPVAGFAGPQKLAAWPAMADLVGLTIPDQGMWDVRVVVADGVGNEASATFTARVDLVAPPAVNVTATALDARLPAVRLQWEPVASNADGSGGPVDHWEVRYSRTPIATDADFDAACPAEALVASDPLPAPVAPGGSAMVWVARGPDLRDPAVEGDCVFVAPTDGGTWYFAVRAVDAAGNASPIGAGSVAAPSGLGLAYEAVSADASLPDADNFNRYVFGVGDVNADGYDDVAVGGRSSSGFCLVFGRADAVLPAVLSPTASGVQCFFDATDTGLGSPVVAAGDLDGDGVADFAAAAGWAGKYGEEVRVWRGKAGGGSIDATPALTIVGTSNSLLYGLAVAGGGNFDGDVRADTGLPLDDLLVADRDHNTVWVVPGAASWPSATLDLSDPTSRAAFGVVGIELSGAATNAGFGFKVAFAGDVLADADGVVRDDVVVTQSKQPAQVWLVAGRAGGGDVVLSAAGDGSQPDDATAVRMQPDADAGTTALFGTTLAGGRDADGDGVPDVLVSHPYDGRVYVYRGAALAASLGSVVTVGADAPSATTVGDTTAGANGWRIETTAGSVAWVDFDGGPLATPDLVYAPWDLWQATYGQVSIRPNAPGADGSLLGWTPWATAAIAEPVPMNNPAAFGFALAPAGDFDGDGAPDFIVGTKGEGFFVLVH